MTTTTTDAYRNFDLLITRAGDGYRAYVIDAPGGDANVTFALPFRPGEIGRLIRRSGARRSVRPAPEAMALADLRQLGERLYNAVFRDRVRSVLAASQHEADAAGQDLRIRLRFSDSAVGLATLPWEILFDPEQQHFLVHSESRPIVRYLSLPRSRPPLVIKPPRSVLAVLASPTDHMPLDVEQEWQAVERALASRCASGCWAIRYTCSTSSATASSRQTAARACSSNSVHDIYRAYTAKGAPGRRPDCSARPARRALPANNPSSPISWACAPAPNSLRGRAAPGPTTATPACGRSRWRSPSARREHSIRSLCRGWNGRRPAADSVHGVGSGLRAGPFCRVRDDDGYSIGVLYTTLAEGHGGPFLQIGHDMNGYCVDGSDATSGYRERPLCRSGAAWLGWRP